MILGSTLRRAALALTLTLAVSSACSSDGESATEGSGDADDLPIASVTVPPERLTTFCQSMIELSDRLETDPPDDTTALIVETYESVVDEVPVEIAAEFDAVLESLRTGAPVTVASSATTPTTGVGADPGSSAPEVDEFFLPDDPPAVRVNSYVESECRSVANNPGPPATEPLDEAVDDTIESSDG